MLNNSVLTTTLPLRVKAVKMPDGGVQVYYSDGRPFAHFGARHSCKPDYRNKWVTLNCYRYQLDWVRP